jgi:hypothetical protein
MHENEQTAGTFAPGRLGRLMNDTIPACTRPKSGLYHVLINAANSQTNTVKFNYNTALDCCFQAALRRPPEPHPSF